MTRIRNSPDLANPVGFSHAVVAKGTVVALAGQVAMNREGAIVAPGDIVRQFEVALGNIRTAAEYAGARAEDIISMRINVTDRKAYKQNLPRIGEIYRSIFGSYFPAMILVEVRGLYDDDAMVEIEALAVID
jgi:enamine deaminase RidA (YjgF/YER057c/UK114 family)